MRPVLQLIVSQSESLLAIIDQFGDNAEQRFLSGDDPLAFLRSRGVLSDEAGTLPHFDALKVTDRYKLAGTVEMGPLLDMVAGALDALDIAYDLFATDDAEDDHDADDEADVDGNPADAPVAADAPPEDAALEADAAHETEADADTDADTEIDGDGAAAVEVAAAETENAVTPSSLAQALQSLQRAERAH